MQNYNTDDIYNMIGIRKNSSLEEIKVRIDELERFEQMNPSNNSKKRLYIAKELYKKMCLEKQEGPDILITEVRKPDYDELLKQFEPKTLNDNITQSNNNKFKTHEYILDKTNNSSKQAKSVKLKVWSKRIIAGVLVCVCAFGVKSYIKDSKQTNKENNVCVEYTVQEGDSKRSLSELFKDYDFSYYEVTGPYRNIDYIYEGDVVIGRTTKEVADKLVAEGSARIISIDEAVELLEEKNNLTGEFRKYAEGESDMVFFVPEQKTMI